MEYLSSLYSGSSGDNSTNTYPSYVGFISAGVAVIMYGSNFVPVKKFETGDGMFFQWVLCSSIFMCGVVVQLIRSNTKFYPLSMVGGAVWVTGNLCVVPVIKTIGLGLGMCIWGTVNLIGGWATGTFGLFGLEKQPASDKTMNYIGVAAAVCSAVLLVFVKSDVSGNAEQQRSPEREALLSRHYDDTASRDSMFGSSENQDVLIFNKRQTSNNSVYNADANSSDETFFDRMSTLQKRIFGVVLSIASGVLYSQIFTPSLYTSQTDDTASSEMLDYVFPTFCGIFLTSTVYLVIYTAFMQNKPRVYPKVILPGIISGIMWGIATSCWFIANEALSEAISFPLISSLPGIIAAVWGVIVFREVKGIRNYIFFLAAFAFSILCGILTGLSK